MPELVHATAIALSGRAALIRGLSGTGKSDLALRCIAATPSSLVSGQALLVADDQVLIEKDGARLFVGSPPSIRGMLEVRGLGIVTVPVVERAELALVVDLVLPGDVERMPNPTKRCSIAGVEVPHLNLAPFETSAPLKVLLALTARQSW